MIRRDYILRMIEEMILALKRIGEFKEGERWEDAAGAVSEEFQRLLGMAPEAVSKMSETELLARLMKGEPTLVVRDKALLVTTLLNEAGDIAAQRDQMEESRACYLKGLHLLLDTLAQGDAGEFPHFVPKVEQFVDALSDQPLPSRTLAMLMQHYERIGEFGRAEDMLYTLLDAEPENPGVADFGISFYERIARLGDRVLEEGNLPRSELQEGLAELKMRHAK
jgi:hypothetical protein